MLEGRERDLLTLARVEMADADQQRPVDAERRLGRCTVDRMEAREVDAGMVDADLLLRQPERDHVPLQRRADREHAAGGLARGDDLRGDARFGAPEMDVAA